jgi:hypothetical protein
MSEEEKHRLKDMITKLKQQRDELSLKIHLGKAEAKDEWAKISAKLDQVLRDYQPLKNAVGETGENVFAALKLVTEEIQRGFDRIRKSL